MSIISKKFADELADKRMRDAYLAAQTRTRVAYQIRAIRTQRDWSQGDLADALDTSQSAVSRLEDRQYGSMNVKTLLDLAATFNCGLVIEFVPYADFLVRTRNLSPENLGVSEFSAKSLEPLSRDFGGAAATVNVSIARPGGSESVDIAGKQNSNAIPLTPQPTLQ